MKNSKATAMKGKSDFRIYFNSVFLKILLSQQLKKYKKNYLDTKSDYQNTISEKEVKVIRIEVDVNQ